MLAGWKSDELLTSAALAPVRTTIEWAESHNFPPFSQAKMEDTRFVDLKVKVGFPYLYCHQGDCEHLVIITDIRSKHVLLQQRVSAPALEHVFASLRAEILDLTNHLRICCKSMTSSTFILPGRSIWWFCHETGVWKDTVLVTRCDIKPSLVSLNCASQDVAVNLVPRIGGEGGGEGQWQESLRAAETLAEAALHVTNDFFLSFTGWPTGATAWTRRCIRFSHTSTGSPRRSAASATSSSEGAFFFFQVEAREQTRTLNPLLSPDGSPPATGWLRATPASSATSASECCTMTNTETSWENSRPSHLWTAVPSTNAPLGTPV